MQVIRHNVSDFGVTSYYRMGIFHGKFNETYLKGVIRMEGAYIDGNKYGKWRVHERYLD